MRVLKVTQSYAPFYEFGGPPVKVEALARGLVKRGHAITVLTSDWGFEKRLPAEQTGAKAYRSPFGWTCDWDGVQSIYLPTWARYRALSWNPAVRRYCRARLAQFDIVHIFGLYDLLGLIVASECRERKIPYLVEPIGMFVPIVRNLFLKRLYHKFWGSGLLNGASAIIATSEQEVRELAEGGINTTKIVLRRNGVMIPRDLPPKDIFRTRHKLPADALVVLFLGRLSEKKSPDMLLEAFAQLPAEVRGRNVRLVFAGPDESGMLARLQQMAAERGVANRVSFTGAVFGDEKWSAYRDADVFVLPSRNENFGNTAVEAAACGTPVVLTENCGVAPLLRDCGGTVVRYETTEVARAVQAVLSDEGLRCSLSEGGKRAASVLGWEEPVAQMERLYQSFILSS